MNAVAKVVRSLGIRAISHRRFRVRTTDSSHEVPVAGNAADRDFTAAGPSDVGPSDVTVIPTREGWPYLAVVEDPFSRRVVGGSTGTSLESRLVVDALHAAVAQRFPDDGLLAHSDRGRQCAGDHDQRVLSGHGVTCGMSRAGNCCDSAPVESFFASPKADPTATAFRRRRCRTGRNGGDRASVGVAGVGPLRPGVPHPHRRNRTVSDRPVPIPARA